MFKIKDDKSIHISRGDVGTISIAVDDNGTPYTFKKGDVVRLLVMEKKKCDSIVLTKTVNAVEGATSIDIPLTSTDTKIGEVINRPVTCWYEVELNPTTNPNTIIGYDDRGAKLFVVYPEGVA